MFRQQSALKMHNKRKVHWKAIEQVWNVSDPVEGVNIYTVSSISLYLCWLMFFHGIYRCLILIQQRNQNCFTIFVVEFLRSYLNFMCTLI